MLSKQPTTNLEQSSFRDFFFPSVMKNIHSTPMGGRESLFEKPGLESATLPKRPCPGLSMYLSERINWIISSFPWWISKILFVLGSWDHFGSLGCRIGECPFRYVLVLFQAVCISKHRYFMTDCTENNKIFSDTKILFTATLFLISNYAFTIATKVLVVFLDLPNRIIVCSGLSTNDDFHWLMVINNISTLTITVFGLYADISLHR